MIRTGLFDIAAHADAIRRERFQPPPSLDEEYESVARLLKSRGMSIEVSTAGLRRGAGAPYPAEELLRACVKAGVTVTLGSDAHTPQDVGRDYDVALRLLRAVGV